jgi:cation diffusion facilitator CzcD-associated flavoprotein CzcO
MADSPATLEAPRGAPAAGREAVPVIVGAGPAGLATARELVSRGVYCRVLERGPATAHVWRNLYDSLRLHTGRHLSALPGLPFPRRTPLFPSRNDFVNYLDRYRVEFGIDVETGTDVLCATPQSGRGWTLATSKGEVHASALVMATGIVSWPVVPRFEGQETFGGRIMHSVEYRRPEPFAGRRVLVVGCGNSGGEIASELADSGAEVTVAVRSGANVVPLTLLGVPIQYVAFALRDLPRPAKQAVVRMVGWASEKRRGPPVLPRPAYGPLDRIPLIGFHLVNAINAGKVRVAGAIASFTARGARFSNGEEAEFDDVILATGFRPALQPVVDHVRVDAAGFAVRTDRVTSADRPDLLFVGHNYDSTGGIMNIARDAPIAAERIASA